MVCLAAYNVKPGTDGTIAQFNEAWDVPAAARYFRESCRLVKKEAFRYLGDIYYEEQRIKGNFQKAFEIYKKGRAMNDARSTF